jgi:hypothetical protein
LIAAQCEPEKLALIGNQTGATQMTAGIDYSLGRSNVNLETGIHYGVISQNSISQAWCDSAEPDYGDATCPVCECETLTYNSAKHETFKQFDSRGCADYACEYCETSFDSQDCFSEEANGWNYEGDGYVLTDCLDSAVFVISSPFYTFTQFCSPCVPGAGNLDSPDEDGIKTYCVGHDWFEDGEAPYAVFSVATNELVSPSAA